MKDRFRPVPQSRLGRLAAFGQIAGGVATGMLGEGLRRLAQGERPHLSDLLLTPSNALKVTDQLSRMRGAAMKLGQMLSLDAGELLPPELTAILAQLRDTAHFMPPGQLQQTLNAAWGPGWRRHFLRFDNTPIAAASIGQVHRAVLTNGRELAIKVQYPGIASSIDADIDNAATLLRLSGLLPPGLDISRHLAAAKQQLHEEADYLREAEQMRRFGALLADDPRFVLPSPMDDLLHPTVLPMDFLQGTPIESLSGASESDRNNAMTALLDLVLRELFEFGLMQTDPNFGNYRWQRDTGRIVLLDFGATRPVNSETAQIYRNLMKAGLSGDLAAIRNALLASGFVSPTQLARHGKTLDTIIGLGVHQLHENRDGLFDFAQRDLVMMMRNQAAPMLADRSTWHLPAADTLFTQRKISGMALLCSNMRARVPLMQMLSRYS
ncbi:AarF/ABC1/UbiB kinase family protein [Rhizobium sp. RU36D]|uniref:ABC1 kinase family protein n=1 Tax=Rhizobium sp. RU36D TaxID=1907415 RepID=UPI0009D8545E|nr:AarF/ABC1/UbiB kinase family protein [Rhizobium sp. RU36D]SMC94791.1 ABC1 family protein [Rhizobium sp. RU36D]